MYVFSQRIRVLITVLASPEPSSKYGDTVCVAGIRIDGDRAEWVRLYPYAPRWVEKAHRFRKFDVIDVDVHRGSNDNRPESFRPDLDSISVIDHIDDRKQRHAIVARLPKTSTCELSEYGATPQAPSLGLVPVRSLDDILIEPFDGWTPAQQKRIADAQNLSPLELFSAAARTPPMLEAPRFVARYEYKCMANGCNGHTGQILDWELTALQLNLKRFDDESAKREIEKKFRTEMFSPEREPSFFMGNFAAPAKRRSFSVLGIYRPLRRETITPAPTLF